MSIVRLQDGRSAWRALLCRTEPPLRPGQHRPGRALPPGGSRAGNTRFHFWRGQREVYLFKRTLSRSVGSLPLPWFAPRTGRCGRLSHGPAAPRPAPLGTFRRASRKWRCCGLSPACRGPELRPRSAEPRRAQRPPPRSAMAAGSAAGQRPPGPDSQPGAPRQPPPRPVPSLLPLLSAHSKSGSSPVTDRFSLMPTNSHEATDKRAASGPRAATRAGHAEERAQPALPSGQSETRQLSRGFLYFCKEK